MELRNYEENAKAGAVASGIMQSRASAAGKDGNVSADRPFPPGVEYEQSTMGVIPVCYCFDCPLCSSNSLPG